MPSFKAGALNSRSSSDWPNTRFLLVPGLVITARHTGTVTASPSPGIRLPLSVPAVIPDITHDNNKAPWRAPPTPRFSRRSNARLAAPIRHGRDESIRCCSLPPQGPISENISGPHDPQDPPPGAGRRSGPALWRQPVRSGMVYPLCMSSPPPHFKKGEVNLILSTLPIMGIATRRSS